jgi:alpha-methylacyl-CoA racemase
MILADLGADVLRLERGNPDADTSPTGRILNRSRPSVAIDLKNDEARLLVLELCEQSDVLVEGFRPGVTERLGLGPTQVLTRNPSLVYARMTGYGQEGPLSQRAGHDINYIALAGALWPIGRAGERPTPPMNLVGDFGGGSMFLICGILSALLSARATGEGQVVDAAMVDGAAAMMAMTFSFMEAGSWREERGVNFIDTGAHFYEVYETSDQRYLAVGAIEPQFYAELLTGLGISGEDLPPQMERESWPVMKERFAAIIASKSRDEWTGIFDGTDACVSPVLSPTEAVVHPYNVARGVFDTDNSAQPRPAPRFSKTPGSIRRAPQAPGAGTRDGLENWGIDRERQAILRAAGAFG